ncbi:MAG: pentapeptide repeat-containing protein, partial [Bacteroidia bacterium]|nr:pentapeptide repeat-containing protein [Bacteroidia bacterium]
EMEAAKFQFGDIRGAMLHGANLSRADFLKTNMARVDVSMANLRMANLQRADLSEANFQGAELWGVALQEEDWISRLSGWKVAGEKVIRAQYFVTKDTARRYHDVHYLLLPISQ